MTSVSNLYIKFGFPPCLGTVDGTHIDIKQPACNSTAPSSVHDVRIFVNSKINQTFCNGDMASCAREIVPGEKEVPVLILGDPAYPLLPFLVKEYASRESTRQEQYFGLTLCRARMVIECAFGR